MPKAGVIAESKSGELIARTNEALVVGSKAGELVLPKAGALAKLKVVEFIAPTDRVLVVGPKA